MFGKQCVFGVEESREAEQVTGDDGHSFDVHVGHVSFQKQSQLAQARALRQDEQAKRMADKTADLTSLFLPYLIERGQHPRGDDGPEADLRKQRERSKQEETVDQQLDGVRIRKLRQTYTHEGSTEQGVGSLFMTMAWCR